jgi:hypothetical protein
MNSASISNSVSPKQMEPESVELRNPFVRQRYDIPSKILVLPCPFLPNKIFTFDEKLKFDNR